MSTLDPWFEFYREFFKDPEDARRFVSDCEERFPPDNAAKIIMHQAQRA